MAKTSIEIDTDQMSKAQEILGLSTIKETVDTAIRRIVAEDARKKFVEFASTGYFEELLEPEVERKMWS